MVLLSKTYSSIEKKRIIISVVENVLLRLADMIMWFYKSSEYFSIHLSSQKTLSTWQKDGILNS